MAPALSRGKLGIRQQTVESQATNYNWIHGFLPDQRVVTHCTGIYRNTFFGSLVADSEL